MDTSKPRLITFVPVVSTVIDSRQSTTHEAKPGGGADGRRITDAKLPENPFSCSPRLVYRAPIVKTYKLPSGGPSTSTASGRSTENC